jgi:hypothetical protein
LHNELFEVLQLPLNAHDWIARFFALIEAQLE